MSTYTFHLQSVLEFREDVENEKRQHFLSEEEQLKKTYEELRLLDEELMNVRTTIDTERFTVSEYQQMVRYKDSLLLMRDTLTSRIQKQEALVEQTKEDWQEAKKEVMMLLKLKEKNELAFKEELERKEAQELDELSTMRF